MKGKSAQVLRGLGPNCFNNNNITNCHYADDTIFFLEAQPDIIEAAWWTMQAFEAISGIKVNLEKTEMYAINTNHLDQLASVFKCKTATFPIKYLGLPLHDKKLSVKDWNFLIDKIEKKLQNWKGQLLSIGGRQTLLNYVLSAVPLYALSLYRVPLTVLKDIDKIRCRFLWQGTDKSRKKYALLRWSVVCLTKSHGGLGVLDLRDMNFALLSKWLWKFKDPTYTSNWKTLITYLYSENHQTHVSSFWLDLLKLDTLCSGSIQYTPGSNSRIKFWEDIWLENCSLSVQYPQLYNLCLNKHILLSDVLNSQGESVHFGDILSGVNLIEWNQILFTLSHLSFTHEFDKLSWRWDHTGRFSV